ncbi:acyltransferase family protein [Pantoea sp. SGAir0175]
MRLNSLTSLRFIAAFGVFLHHFHMLNDSKNHIINWFSSILFEGFVGVTFFYVLSGFIISYSHKQHCKAREFKVSDFLYNRIARLYPVHIITLFIAIYFYIPSYNYGLIHLDQFAYNLFLVQSLIPDPQYFFSFNGVSWSVSAEMFFYVAFIFLVTLNNKQLIIFFGMMLALIVYHMIAIPDTAKYVGWTYYINPAFRVIDFMAGMLLFRLYDTGKLIVRDKFATAMEFGSLIILTAAMAYGMKNVGMKYRYDLFYLIPMMFIVYIFSYGKGVISRVISYRPVVFLGEASFSLYMIHQICIYVASNNYKYNLDSMASTFFFMAFTMGITIGISCILYHFYEKPINDSLRKLRYRNRK